MDTNSPERPPLELTKYPILHRAVSHQSQQDWNYRYPIMGEVLEGFEIWLPYLIPVYQASMVETRFEVRLDGVPIGAEFSVARFRRRYGNG